MVQMCFFLIIFFKNFLLKILNEFAIKKVYINMNILLS